jgi:hypothetical protein
MLNSVLRNPRGIWAVVALGALVAAVFWTPISAEPAKPADYVGMKKCKACHYKYYKAWVKLKHAQSWEKVPEKYRGEERCIKCHTTGYGEPTGFVSVAKTPRLTSVQCEVCHGPGSAHAEAVENDKPEEEFRSLINKVPQNVCIKCHKPHEPHEEYQK